MRNGAYTIIALRDHMLTAKAAWHVIAAAFERYASDPFYHPDHGDLASAGLCYAIDLLHETKLISYATMQDMQAQLWELRDAHNDMVGCTEVWGWFWPLDSEGAASRVVAATMLAEELS